MCKVGWFNVDEMMPECIKKRKGNDYETTMKVMDGLVLAMDDIRMPLEF
jgi:hypothetical protein